jgi:uncharacterized protein (TIGR00369 family)
VALHSYPPPHHILGDLGMEAEITSETTANVRIRVTPHITAADGGVRAGVLATLVDIVGGAVAARALRPDWMATADLSLQLVRPAPGPWVEARGTVVRKGRTTLVIEALVVNVADDGSDVGVDGGTGGPVPVAWATMTFAILPSRNAGAPLPAASDLPVRWAFDGGGLEVSVLDALALSVVDAAGGRVSMPVGEYLVNSFGAVQGGVIALLGDVAGSEALGAAQGPGGQPALVTDLQVAYLALGRVGPMVSRARVLDDGSDGSRGSAVIELFDQGADGRLTTVINVGTASPVANPVAESS